MSSAPPRTPRPLPSFGEQRAIVERWPRFPSRERLDDHRVALTFDDGPDPDGTPAVLDALDAIGARATFFMVGEQAEAHPGLAREVARRGHGIGLHGLRHVRPPELADPEGDPRRALGSSSGPPASLDEALALVLAL